MKNTQVASEDPRVIVSVEDGGNQMSNGCKGIAPTLILVAKLENTDFEVGRARLCMPNHQDGHGAQGLFIPGDISIDAPDMDMVTTALIHKARELLPNNNIVIHHKGPMPKNINPVEEYSTGFYILKAIPSPV